MAAKKAVRKTEKSLEVIKEEAPMSNKLREPKVFIPLIIIILAAVLFFFKGFFIAALVNGQPISRISLISDLEKKDGKQALSALVNQTLILQEAKKKNVDVSQKEVDGSAKQIEDSLKKQGQNLDSALAMQGLTRQDFLMQLRLRALVEKLLGDKIKVSDKEIADYIEKNKSTLPAGMSDKEIKTGVKQQLEQQKMSSQSQSWLQDLQKNAKINYFVNY